MHGLRKAFTREKVSMHISANYSASGILSVPSAHPQKRASFPSSGTSFDTVSISPEALLAYKNSSLQEGGMSNEQLEAKLTTFFNRWHYGPDFPVNENIAIKYGPGELLPENKALKETFEKAIDKIFADYDHSVDDGPVPQEILNKWRPLVNKLDAIAALGDVLVLDEATLETAANFLQKLESSWSEMVNEDVSLSGQFRSATHAWKEQPQTEEEIQEKIEKKKRESLEEA